MITWFNEKTQKSKNCIATIYDTNITLNKNACELLQSPYTVMLGLDYDQKVLYIKPLSKDVATRGDIPADTQYQISIGSSYGRISNVDFVKEIKNLLEVDSLKENPKKFNVSWLDKDKTLKIDLNVGVEK